MTEPHTAEENLFRSHPKLATEEYQVRVLDHGALIRFTGGPKWNYWDMVVSEATDLRDWLNKVLP